MVPTSVHMKLPECSLHVRRRTQKSGASNSLQSVLMASGADAREAEVSATLNLFRKKRKKRENVKKAMEAFSRSFIYFLKQIFHFSNRKAKGEGLVVPLERSEAIFD